MLENTAARRVFRGPYLAGGGGWLKPWRLPHIAAGSRVSALLNNLDFAPTVQDLVGLSPSTGGVASHGRSFAGLLTGTDTYQPHTV